MKKTILSFVLLLFSISFLAQNLSVSSFKKLENDLDARVSEPLKDPNGEVCAIIKVVTTQTGFSFDCGMAGVVKTVNKPAEIWVYVPNGAKRITISHPVLGILRDWFFTQPIQKATVYELVLITGNVITTVEETIVSQWLVISPEPKDASIYINDVFVKNGTYLAKYKSGKYIYRVEAPLYHSEVGNVEIDKEKKELNVKL
jgi:hypothetical protein